MTKRKDISQQRLLAAARKALAARNAVTPVPAYNSKVARIDGVRKRVRNAENAPPPEQMAKAPFVETDVNEFSTGYDAEGNPYVNKVRIGRAFLRQPRFETIEGLSMVQLLALRRYRRAFDTSELSPVKSQLDIGSGGGTGGAEAAISRMEAIAFADIGVRRIEAALPAHLLPTLRAVALHDQDFKAVALSRHGSGSSRRRQRVRDEFLRAAEALARPVLVASAPAAEPVTLHVDVAPLTPINPAYLDAQGFMRPLAEIATIIANGGEFLATQDEQA